MLPMKVLSWNVRGLGGVDRRLLVKEIVRKNKVSIVMLQETKLSSMLEALVRDMWY